MADTFFGEVPGRIPFGGPSAADPLAYTVYEPDRLVLGKHAAGVIGFGTCRCGSAHMGDSLDGVEVHRACGSGALDGRVSTTVKSRPAA